MNASEVSLCPVGFAKRLLAFAIDFLLIAAYILVLGVIGIGTMRLTSELVAYGADHLARLDGLGRVVL